MSETKKTYLYVNTAPAPNNKGDGTVFWTVLIGLTPDLLSAKGVSEAQAKTLKVKMTVFPDKLELMANAFAKAKAAGLKLVLKCEDFTLTEVKPNNYTNNNGVAVNGFAASCWANGEKTLDVLGSSMGVSEELRKLLDEYNDEEDGDIL
jgi:hypothetical protein